MLNTPNTWQGFKILLGEHNVQMTVEQTLIEVIKGMCGPDRKKYLNDIDKAGIEKAVIFGCEIAISGIGKKR
jgi:hypothetical protein